MNISLIVANFAVWLFYELPHLQSAVIHASFYPCTVTHACHGPEPWGVTGVGRIAPQADNGALRAPA